MNFRLKNMIDLIGYQDTDTECLVFSEWVRARVYRFSKQQNGDMSYILSAYHS